MTTNLGLFFPFLILASCLLLQGTHATKYFVHNTVPNTPGGKVFDQEIGVNFTKALMPKIQRFIYKIFRQRHHSDRVRPHVVNLYISEFSGYAYLNGNNINVNAKALDKFYLPRSKSKLFFTYLMHQAIAYVFQWNGQHTAPTGLLQGVADYVMVKSGFYPKDNYTKRGEGHKWDEEGSGVTERFLEYCDGQLPHFTAKLNKKMRYSYSDKYFVELVGKPVDQLWREYKSIFMYSGKIPKETTLDMVEGLEY